MNMTRRDFLAGLGATLALPKSMLAGDVSAAGSLPGYYAPYLDGIAQKIAADAAKGAANGFFFFTDPHVMSNFGQSGFVVADLVRRTGIRRVFGGGDYSMAFCRAGEPREFVERVLDKTYRLWRDPVESAGGLFLTAKGNHDLRVFTDESKAGGFAYASAKTRELLMATKEGPRTVANPGERSGMYFFRDDDGQKIRYDVADTSDGVLEEDGAGKGYGNYMRKTQLRWIGGVALKEVPPGYGVVVIHHIPLLPFTGSERDAETFGDFRRLLEAYQMRGRVSTSAGEFDFTARAGGDILFDLAGHTHSDRFAFCNGILHIAEICDANYSDPVSRTPFSGLLFKDRKARKGTVLEQAFDIVRFGGGMVRTTRVGAGQDRVFRLKPVTLKVGEKLRLDCGEAADAKWVGFDSWKVRENRGEKDPVNHWTFAHEIADVAPDGVVTAMSPGWATAVALTPDFRKEIVGIQVV